MTQLAKQLKFPFQIPKTIRFYGKEKIESIQTNFVKSIHFYQQWQKVYKTTSRMNVNMRAKWNHSSRPTLTCFLEFSTNREKNRQSVIKELKFFFLLFSFFLLKQKSSWVWGYWRIFPSFLCCCAWEEIQFCLMICWQFLN